MSTVQSVLHVNVHENKWSINIHWHIYRHFKRKPKLLTRLYFTHAFLLIHIYLLTTLVLHNIVPVFKYINIYIFCFRTLVRIWTLVYYYSMIEPKCIKKLTPSRLVYIQNQRDSSRLFISSIFVKTRQLIPKYERKNSMWYETEQRRRPALVKPPQSLLAECFYEAIRDRFIQRSFSVYI